MKFSKFFKTGISLIFICSFFGSFAQQAMKTKISAELSSIIVGEVKEKSNGLPMEFVNISLHRLDSSLVSGTISGSGGKFELDKIPQGKYILKIAFMGYKSLHRNIDVKGKDVINLGAFELEVFSNEISEVQVTGTKSTVEYRLDRKVVNINQNLVSIGGTALDVLRNAPGVQVSPDASITLRGNSNISFLLNGRNSAAFSGTDFLEQMPASSIENIEIITNPSAKFDPDGISGIINIVTKKKTNSGISSILSVNVGTKDKYNSSANITIQKMKSNVITFAYDNRLENRTMTMKSYKEMYSTSSILDQVTNNKFKFSSQSFRIGDDLQINSKNSISLSYNVRQNAHQSNGNTLSNDYTLGDSKLYLIEQDYSKSKNSGLSHDANLSYRKILNNKDHQLSADMTFSNSENSGNNSLDYFDLDPNSLIGIDTIFHHDVSKSGNTNYSLQTDYVLPLKNDYKFEAGLKSVVQSLYSDYRLDSFDMKENLWKNDESYAERTDYDEQIHAAYITLSGKTKYFTYMAGFRFEGSYRNLKSSRVATISDTIMLNYFPTLHVNREFGDKNQIQLSYSKRIRRPRPEELNPYKDRSNPKDVRFGNPNLLPEYIHSYEFSYQKDWKSVFFASTLFYRYTNNEISRYRVQLDSGILGMTYANLSKEKEIGTELVVNGDIFKWWKMNAELSFYENIVENNSDTTGNVRNQSFDWNGRINSTLLLPKMTSLQVSVNYRSPSARIQGTRSGNYTIDLALRKEFFKRSLIANIRLSDVFNTFKFSMETQDDLFYAKNSFKRESRILYFGLTWRFNQDNKAKEGKKRNDSNKPDMDME